MLGICRAQPILARALAIETAGTDATTALRAHAVSHRITHLVENAAVRALDKFLLFAVNSSLIYE